MKTFRKSGFPYNTSTNDVNSSFGYCYVFIVFTDKNVSLSFNNLCSLVLSLFMYYQCRNCGKTIYEIKTV